MIPLIDIFKPADLLCRYSCGCEDENCADCAHITSEILRIHQVQFDSEKCDSCKGTGWYGDEGPGIKGNTEFDECEKCKPKRKK